MKVKIGKGVVKVALKITGTVCLGGAAVLGAMETDEKVQKLLKIVADKVVK